MVATIVLGWCCVPRITDEETEILRSYIIYLKKKERKKWLGRAMIHNQISDSKANTNDLVHIEGKGRINSQKEKVTNSDILPTTSQDPV